MNNYSLPLTENFDMLDKNSGKEYRVSLALPESYFEGDSSYQVLFVPDANLFFGMCVNSVRLMALTFEIPELIIVGIDNPVSTLKESTLYRNNNLTITESQEINQLMLQIFGKDTGVKSGGGPLFLDFIEKELFPLIDQKYRTETNNRIFFGTSLAGLFGTYTFFSKNNLFSNYILGSPAYWYDDEVIFSMEKQFLPGDDLKDTKIFLAVGGQEELDDEYSQKRKMVTNLKKMEQLLSSDKYCSLSLGSFIFDNETHYSVVGNILNTGLKTLLDKPKSPERAQ